MNVDVHPNKVKALGIQTEYNMGTINTLFNKHSNKEIEKIQKYT